MSAGRITTLVAKTRLLQLRHIIVNAIFEFAKLLLEEWYS